MLGDKRSRDDDDHSGPVTLPPNLRIQSQAQNGPPPGTPSQQPQRQQSFPAQTTQQNMISSAGNMSMAMSMGMGSGNMGMNMGIQNKGGPMDALYIGDLQWVCSVITQIQGRHNDRGCSSGRPMKH
jgi:hypothetical protein